jgi:hypothetical protein
MSEQSPNHTDQGGNEVSEDSDDLLPVQLGMMLELEQQRINVQRE